MITTVVERSAVIPGTVRSRSRLLGIMEAPAVAMFLIITEWRH